MQNEARSLHRGRAFFRFRRATITSRASKQRRPQSLKLGAANPALGNARALRDDADYSGNSWEPGEFRDRRRRMPTPATPNAATATAQLAIISTELITFTPHIAPSGVPRREERIRQTGVPTAGPLWGAAKAVRAAQRA